MKSFSSAPHERSSAAARKTSAVSSPTRAQLRPAREGAGGHGVHLALEGAFQSPGQRIAVAEGDDEAMLAIAQHLAVAPHVGGHHRRAAGEGLVQHVGPALVARGEDEDVGRAVVVR